MLRTGCPAFFSASLCLSRMSPAFAKVKPGQSKSPGPPPFLLHTKDEQIPSGGWTEGGWHWSSRREWGAEQRAGRLERMEGSQEEVAVCLLSKEWGYLPSPTVTPNWGTREEREEKSNISLLSKPLDSIPGDSTAFPEDMPVLGHPTPTPDQRM